MHIIPNLDHYPNPGYCAVTLRRSDPEGFFATQNRFRGESDICISVSAVRELATQIGMTTPEELEKARLRVAELNAEVECLTSEAAERQRVLDAYELVRKEKEESVAA
jgi:hypothetical protein